MHKLARTQLPTQERLLYLFEDVGDTVRRRVQVPGSTKELKDARCISSGGYYVCRVDGKLYYIHRLLWIMRTGTWPVNEIDHRDGNRLNNSVANLRDAESCQNSWNMIPNAKNTSGYVGASWCKSTKTWRGTIKARNKWYCQGGYSTAAEAHAWYLQMVVKLRGGFTNENTANA